MNNTIKKIEKFNNHKPIILIGPYSKSLNAFFTKQLIDYYKDKKVILISNTFPKEHLFDFLKSSLEINKHDIYLIEDLCSYTEYSSIINMFASTRDAYLIATSNVDLTMENTNIRGRINTIYYPPFNYDDFLQSEETSLIDYLKNNNEDVSILLKDYKYKDEALKICKIINEQISSSTSFQMLHSISGVNVSLNTFTKIINYLIERHFLYNVYKIDITTRKPLSNYFYIYPSFISDIVDGSKPKQIILNKVLESCVVSKLINERNQIYRIHAKESLNASMKNTFYIDDTNDKYLLNIYLDGNEENLNKFVKFKCYLKKYVLILDNINKFTDEFGVTYLNIYEFLKKGIK